MKKVPQNLEQMFEVISPEAHAKRELRTVDIVRRLGVITPDRVHLKNYPINNPTTIFNPAMVVERDGEVKLYARIVLGYFTYASAVALLSVPLNDICRPGPMGHYPAEIIVYPDNKFDIWGVEDPRVYMIDGKLYMTYCGRTVSYFNPAIRVERTLPVTAVYDGKWRKICVFRTPRNLREFVISDKDSFLVKDGKPLLFHRPHLADERFYLVVSEVLRLPDGNDFQEVEVVNTRVVFRCASFEEKMGWGPPPVRVGREYLFLIHAVDREYQSYRVFAALLELDKGIRVTAITPHYIMRPKEPYEVYGDRPHTIFPCGVQEVDGKLLVSYGAADSAVAFGEIDLSELMSILDKNRLS